VAYGALGAVNEVGNAEVNSKGYTNVTVRQAASATESIWSVIGSDGTLRRIIEVTDPALESIAGKALSAGTVIPINCAPFVDVAGLLVSQREVE